RCQRRPAWSAFSRPVSRLRPAASRACARGRARAGDRAARRRICRRHGTQLGDSRRIPVPARDRRGRRWHVHRARGAGRGSRRDGAMKGYGVARKAGWDTHGLPVEIEVEKQLGISGKQQIEALGVAEFNRLCRESVFTYRGDWERLSARIGYWLDYEHPYITYTNEYVESVWWALKTLF